MEVIKMKLKQLIKNSKNISVKGAKDIVITGITSNSKMVSPGNLFVAKQGLTSDGNAYIPEAIR
ncbi:MAG: murE, partial [Chlamydiia bacterium]|nr:murE [Chlamydiia bacterium]